MIGAAAISGPVSELVRCRSASESSSQAAIISKNAKPVTALQCRRSSVRASADSASGSNTNAPIAERVNTSAGTSSTATVINRYGTPLGCLWG